MNKQGNRKIFARSSMSITEDWWLTEYEEEIHDHLRAKEQKRAVFHAQSPQLHFRQFLVEWLIDICKKRNLSTPVQHLAIYLLDYFMDNHSIQREQLQLVTLGCLLVAAKFEEKDNLIPKTSELNQTVDNMYNLHEFVQMELALVEFFHWDLMVPTTAHFVEYYEHYCVCTTDFHAGRPLPALPKARVCAQHYNDYFLDLSIRVACKFCFVDHTFLQFPPSMVAAAIIAATRICLLISPVWPRFLQKLTYYTSEELSPCIEIMLRLLETEERNSTEKTSLIKKVVQPSDTESSDSLKSSPTSVSSLSFDFDR
ncbi:cyclin J isoform X3 [Tachypleus tridentatus]|uniref:cyclin J isoform X3 n=1 Tax=Tachypleus tridentatus TaxID=6853 RepID=UPI003FD3DA64